MGTDVKIYVEHKNKDGEWEQLYSRKIENAVYELESRGYFKFALWAGVRNYYMLKRNLIKSTRLQERSKSEREKYREIHELNTPRYYTCYDDEKYETHSKYEISLSTAIDITNSGCWIHHVFDIDDIINFDYDQTIEVEIDEKSIYYRDYRELGPHETYRDNLGESYFKNLHLLKSEGVERLLMSFD